MVERLGLVKEETSFVNEEPINIATVAREESMVQEKFKSRHGAGEGTAE